MRFYLLILFSLCFGPFLNGQENIISGKVTDENGEALWAVNVYCKANETGTITGIDGTFRLHTICDTLIFSYIGFKTETIAVNNRSEINVRFSERVELDCELLIRAKYSPPELASFGLGRDKLDLATDVSIAPVLNTVPGVFMHTGAFNTNRITIRGIGNRSQFSTTKVRAYLDEIPLTNGVGETSIEDLENNLLNSARIWKGPSSSLYGAALGGMIELKTRLKDGFQPSSFTSKNIFGAWGYKSSSNRINIATLSSGLNIQLLQGIHQSDGYRDNNNYDRQNYSALIQKLTDKSSFSLLFNYVSLNAQIPSSLNEEDYLNEPSKAALTWGNVMGFEDYTKLNLGLGFEHRMSYKWSVKGSAFANGFDSYESRPFNIIDDESSAYGGRLRFVFDDEQFKGIYASLGAEWYKEKYDWQLFETNDGIQGDLFNQNTEDRTYLNLFSALNWRIKPKWLIQTGINFNQTKYDLTDLFSEDGNDLSGSYQYDGVISPRLSITYKPSYKWSSAFLVSHGFSTPNSEETLTPDGNLNTEIRPEQGWNFENITKYNLPSKNLNFTLNLYSMRIKDLLVSKRLENDQYVGLNAGKTIHNGLELFLHHTFYKTKWIQMNYQVSYAYADFYFDDFIDDDQDYSGNDLTGTSPHTINLLVQAKIQDVYASANYFFRNQAPLRDDNSVFSESFQKVDLRVGYKKLFSEKYSIDVFASANNIFDEQYASMILINASSFGGNAPRYYYPGLPRHINAGLQFSYLWNR